MDDNEFGKPTYLIGTSERLRMKRFIIEELQKMAEAKDEYAFDLKNASTWSKCIWRAAAQMLKEEKLRGMD